MKRRLLMSVAVTPLYRPDVRNPAPAPAAVLRVLAAIDGSERTGRLMNYLLAFAATRGPIEVVLLNVQPKPEEWRMRGYGWFHREEVEDRLVNDLGRRVIESAARHLDSAGIPHRDLIEIGDPGEIVSRCAREEKCDLVAVTERPPGTVRRWLLRAAGLSFGSPASVALHSLDAPVMSVR
jgi:nucleotide-binding universal stress UspA family protein